MSRWLKMKLPNKKKLLRNNALYISDCRACIECVYCLYLLYVNQYSCLPAFYFFTSFSFILVLAYAIPPIRLLDRGFGELTLAVQIAYVIPSIGFLLQAKENHRLLAFIIIPLTALALAYFLIINFTTFPV